MVVKQAYDAHIYAHVDIMYGPCSEGCNFRMYNRNEFDRHCKNVSITNLHNYLLIFGGFLNCGYWGEGKKFVYTNVKKMTFF